MTNTYTLSGDPVSGLLSIGLLIQRFGTNSNQRRSLRGMRYSDSQSLHRWAMNLEQVAHFDLIIDEVSGTQTIGYRLYRTYTIVCETCNLVGGYCGNHCYHMDTIRALTLGEAQEQCPEGHFIARLR